MVPFTLSKVVGDANTAYTSNAVQAVSSSSMVEVEVSSGTLIVNGVDLGTTTDTVSTGSWIAVRLTSAARAGDTVYSVLRVEDQSSLFVLTTSVSGARVYDVENEALPLDFLGTANYQSDEVWSFDDAPALMRMDGLVWRETIDLSMEPREKTTLRDYLFVVNRWADCIYRVDPSESTVDQKINLPSPIAIGRAQYKEQDAPAEYHFYVLLGEGSIARLSAQNNLVSPSEIIPVGPEPSDLLSTDNNVLWVTCAGNDTLTKITIDETNLDYVTEVVSLPAGSKPSQVRELGGYVYVSLFMRNAVAKINKTSLTITYINVGERPYGLDVLGTEVFCVCSGDKTLWNVTTRAKLATLSGVSSPTQVQAQDSGFIVLDVETRHAIEYDDSFDRVRSFKAESPLEIVRYESSNYLFVNGANVHTRMAPVDYLPEALEFYPSLGNDRLEIAESGTYTVRGVNAPTHVSVGPGSESTLVINGADVGTEGYVEEGDTVKVHTVSSDEYGIRTEAVVTMGGETVSFVSTTVDQDAIPDSIVFDPITSAPSFAAQTSNVVTVSGMKEGLTIGAYAVGATLVVNGSDVTGTIAVQNGDTVALRVETGALDTWTHGTLYVGPIQATFSVNVLGDPCDDWNIAFINRGSVKIGTHVVSNQVTVPAGVNNETISLIDAYNGELFINDEATSRGQTAVVSAGDKIAIQMQLTSAYGLRHIQTLNVCRHTYTWSVITEPDTTPYFFTFETVRGKDADEEALSEKQTLSGMDEGAIGTASIFPEADILLNGVRINTKPSYSPIEEFTFNVTDGDSIVIAGRAGSPFGTARKYTLTIGKMVTTYSIYSRPVDGAYENPQNYYLVEEDKYGYAVSVKSLASNVDPAEPSQTVVGHHVLHDLAQVDRHSIRTVGTKDEVVQPVRYANQTAGFEQPESEWKQHTTDYFDQPESEWKQHTTDFFNRPDAEWQQHTTDYFDQPDSEWQQHTKDTFDRPDVELQQHTTDFFDRPEVKLQQYASDTFDRPDVEQAVTTPSPLASGTYERKVSHARHYLGVEFDMPPKYASYYLDIGFDTHPQYTIEEIQTFFCRRTPYNIDPLAIFGFDMPPQYTTEKFSWGPHWNKQPEMVKFEELAPNYDEKITVFADMEKLELTPTSYTVTRRLFGEGLEPYKPEKHSVDSIHDPQPDMPAHPTVETEAEIEASAYASRFSDQPVDYDNTISHSGAYAQRQTVVGQHFGRIDYLGSGPEKNETLRKLSKEQKPQPKGEDKFAVASGGTIQRSFTSINVTPPRAEFERASNETFEDEERQILTPDLMNYRSSHEDAYQEALDSGVAPERIQTYELYPDCWVWAEVLDQPNLCEVIPTTTSEAGWIKGG